MAGYISLHRQILDNSLWQDKPFSRGQAWVDLLLMASYTDHSFWVRGIEVKVCEGQIAMSEITMSKRWGWSRDKVRRFLSCLENAGSIRQQKSHVTSLITVENWGRYQGGDTTNKTTDRQQTDNKQDTINKGNKGNKGNKEPIKNLSGRFTPPEVWEVIAYCQERDNGIDGQEWHDFYTAKGWMVGKTKMKDWKAAVRTWEKSRQPKKSRFTF